MPERYTKLKCLGRDVTMIVDPEKGVAFDGYDERAERSLKAFGKKDSSPCWIVAHAVVEGTLDEKLIEHAEKDNFAIVGALVDAGADVHTEGDLADAELAFVDQLPEYFSDHTDQPLRKAASRGHADTVLVLLDKGANIHAAEDDALRSAARWGHAEVVEILLNARPKANIHAVDNQALRKAAEEGHYDVVEVLLNARPKANVHADDDAALIAAALGDHEDVVEILLQHNANARAQNSSALEYATQGGHVNIVQMLLAEGASFHDFEHAYLGRLTPEISRIMNAWLKEHPDD